ncbi:hypothetical protein FRX31_028225 [Thalictrum thalictroides]|uniref:Uncharacterized protein n=1 Tax=Thalictrum thalictroides TaxID=46969 RepID=A0A7J6VC35_THATH|nr:hypothetical protein FRX31_028225 [Thalictrum thalictroides]
MLKGIKTLHGSGKALLQHQFGSTIMTEESEEVEESEWLEESEKLDESTTTEDDDEPEESDKVEAEVEDDDV